MEGLERFLKKDSKQDEFREYNVNVLVDNSEIKGIPIIFETSPSYKNLFGTIERYTAQPGMIVSDFLNIKTGSLLRANGGYLVINAFDALYSEICVREAIAGGSNFPGFQESDLAINEKEIPAAFPAPPSIIIING